jgi:hypothetical protein
MTYKIYDNFLNIADLSYLEDTILLDKPTTGPKIRYIYSEEAVSYTSESQASSYKVQGYENSLVGHPQLVHMIYHNYSWVDDGRVDILKPFISKINPLAWHKAKLNLTISTIDPIIGGWHTDMPLGTVGGRTAVFSVNDNNGYTMFKDGTRIDSIANRLVIFDSNEIHTGVTNTDGNNRFTLNLNYFGGLSH